MFIKCNNNHIRSDTDLPVNLGAKRRSVRARRGMIRYTHMLQMTGINVDKPSVQISGGYSEQRSVDVSRTESYMARSWDTVGHEYIPQLSCVYTFDQ